MRNISFALTTEQFLDGTKTVTRRLGWENLKQGELLCAVEKSQGLKRGEKVKKLGTIRALDARREFLDRLTADEDYGEEEVRKEGFPDYTPGGFVAMFCEHNRCESDICITRIEFERVDAMPKREAA